MDVVERRIASTGAQLEIVEKALADPRTYNEEGNQWMKQFKSYCFSIICVELSLTKLMP